MNLQFFTRLEVQSLCLSTSVGGQNGGEGTDFVLDLLIHPGLGFTLAQCLGHCIPVKIAEIYYSSKSQAELSSPTSKVTSLASGFSQASPE